MVVRKILEKTLTAGSTSISFTDSDIPNSLIRVYSSKSNLFPVSQTLSGNVITITYEAQSSDTGIALEIVKQGLDIVDDVTSDDSDKALSAKQGKALKTLIDNIVIPTVPENITDLDDVAVSDIQDNQVLAWNSTSEKFENVNQSGGGSGSYYPLDSTPVKIGKAGDYDLYRQYYSGSNSGTSYTIDTSGGWNITKIIVNVGGWIKGSDGGTTLVMGYNRNNWGNGMFIGSGGGSLTLYMQPNATNGFGIWVDYYVIPT